MFSGEGSGIEGLKFMALYERTAYVRANWSSLSRKVSSTMILSQQVVPARKVLRLC